jgi:hypothetical protein
MKGLTTPFLFDGGQVKTVPPREISLRKRLPPIPFGGRRSGLPVAWIHFPRLEESIVDWT